MNDSDANNIFILSPFWVTTKNTLQIGGGGGTRGWLIRRGNIDCTVSVSITSCDILHEYERYSRRRCKHYCEIFILRFPEGAIIIPMHSLSMHFSPWLPPDLLWPRWGCWLNPTSTTEHLVRTSGQLQQALLDGLISPPIYMYREVASHGFNGWPLIHREGRTWLTLVNFDHYNWFSSLHDFWIHSIL